MQHSESFFWDKIMSAHEACVPLKKRSVNNELVWVTSNNMRLVRKKKEVVEVL